MYFSSERHDHQGYCFFRRDNIENLDLFGQQFGGSLRDINIKGIINDGLWKGLTLDVDANLATPELKLVAQIRDKTMTEVLIK